MSDSVMLPEVKEIESWLEERCHFERLRLRNELAFIRGDRAHGGPSREHLVSALQIRLAAIAQRFESLNSAHGHVDRDVHSGS